VLAAGLAARLPARPREADHSRAGPPAPRSQPLAEAAGVVAWQPWGDGAFARARASGRPVLLSLSASWCGACHRMDEETWEDPGAAAVGDRTTVPVRVDADERPDLYGRYHLGGLPSTAVLSPEGEFIRGGTFLSPAQLLGLLESARADLREGRRPSRRARAGVAGGTPLVTEMGARPRPRAAREHGGLGAGEKLPEPEAVTLLLREWRRGGDAELAAIARASLDAVATHLVDPTDGGFFPYAAGADWVGPPYGGGGGGPGRADPPLPGGVGGPGVGGISARRAPRPRARANAPGRRRGPCLRERCRGAARRRGPPPVRRCGRGTGSRGAACPRAHGHGRGLHAR